MDWRQLLVSGKSHLDAMFGGNLTVGIAILIVAALVVLVITVIDRQLNRTVTMTNQSKPGDNKSEGITAEDSEPTDAKPDEARAAATAPDVKVTGAFAAQPTATPKPPAAQSPLPVAAKSGAPAAATNAAPAPTAKPSGPSPPAAAGRPATLGGAIAKAASSSILPSAARPAGAGAGAGATLRSSATIDAAPPVAKVGKSLTDAADDPLSLEGTALAPLDRVFPTKPLPFLMLVVILSAGAWGAGFALAPDRKKFLASPEWQFMPFYLAAHLIAVRLFVTTFTRNFRAGVQHLDVATVRATRGVRAILGLIGILLAILIAAPFCTLDFFYLNSKDSRYERMGGDIVAPIDLLMWGTWCVEWFLNSLIWVMLLGFLIKNCEIIRAYAFRSPIELVVHERQYRPFLQMSSQGASIVLGFSAVTIFYLWYTGGELTDYAGLTITAVLLIIGFVPPWVLLRRKVRTAVENETHVLKYAILNVLHRDANAKRDGKLAGPRIPLEQRLEEALAIFRVSHLEQLKLNLGRREARAILLRLMAPGLGMVWQLSQNQQSLLAKMDELLLGAKKLLARLIM